MKKRLCYSIGLVCMLVFVVACSMPGGGARSATHTTVSRAATNFNYADAFAKSILFYEASWCGPDAGNNRLPWRGPCHTGDGSDVGIDLTGGFHDAGDHVKFGLPQGYAASTLGWAFYEYKDVFTAKGQDGYMLNILKHFTDYFLKSFPNSTTFYYQCGDGTTDHSYWGPPELQQTSRPSLFAATPSSPASDVTGEAAAALALMYLNYGDRDPSYADKCLSTAKDLYTFADTYRGLSQSGGFYGSTGYLDDLTWAAIWLYIATGDSGYMADIESFLNEKGITDTNGYNNTWTHCWDDVWGGVFVKLAQISDRQLYKDIAEDNLDYWMNRIPRTPGGLCYLNSWGALRYTAAECMLALVYYKSGGNQAYLDFAKSQIDYILGNNPRNGSYVVGFGSNYPKFPHHRAASGRFESPPANESKNDPEKHLLYGALVGGPDSDDNYADAIDEYAYSEVAIDYNAGFVGAMAGMVKNYGMSQTPEATPGIEPDTSPYYVSAYVMNENGQQSTIKAFIHNDSLLPPHYETALAFRYFFDLSEYYNAGYTAADVTASIYYGPLNGTISPLTAWDEANHIYYIEAGWPSSEVYGKVAFQFAIAAYNSSVWDPSNDFSRADLATSAPDSLTERIPVYRDGVLIFGEEPVAGAPTPTPTATPTPTPTPTATPTPTPTPTPTATPSPTPTSTPSPTPTPTAPCDNPASVSIPFTYDGAGEYCWLFSTVPQYINSWNLAELTINGVDYTNTWVAGSVLPAAIDGVYYVHYRGNYAWSHVEIR